MVLGFTEDLFWSLTPKQIETHTVAARKRLRLERNMMMETAYHAALAPHQKTPPRLKDLLIPDDGPVTRRRQPWQEMKAHLILALGGPRKEA